MNLGHVPRPPPVEEVPVVGILVVCLLIGILVACGAALRDEDVASLHDCQATARMAYEAAGAKSPAGQLARGAYCACAAVLRRNDAGAGTDFRCQP
jgi:hypothetical protein